MKHAGAHTEINDRTPEVVASPASDQLAASAYVVSDRPVVLALREFTAGYAELAAIRDVSLSVRAGEVVALFGPNSAGKSTTLRAAVGGIPPMSGQMEWSGNPPRGWPLHRLFREGLAYVPEDRSVTATLSVEDNLRLGRGGLDKAVAHFPELKPLLSRRTGLLSGGAQKILVLARAVASNRKAIFADEISLGLAPLIVERLLDAVRQTATTDGIAVLLVEQQVRRGTAVADRCYLLNSGRIRPEGDRTAGDCGDRGGLLR